MNFCYTLDAMTGFEIIDHTADAGLIARGTSIEQENGGFMAWVIFDL